jgi:hypothetical protein
MSLTLPVFRRATRYFHAWSSRAWFSKVGLTLSLLGAAGSLANAATYCANPGGTGGCQSTISAAVALAHAYDTVVVAEGTYKEQVTITQMIALVARDAKHPPTINAAGFSNGIYVNGMVNGLSTRLAHVVISGFNVKNANYEGILAVNATDLLVRGNHVFNNNKGLVLGTPATCPGIPTWETSEQMDCGEGIHLVSIDDSTIADNESDGNSGGILTTDEVGKSWYILISHNHVHDNPFACGITLASHPPAAFTGAPLAFQISNVTIANNESAHNGLGLPGAGAGVGIFAAGPGNGAYQNVVIHNHLHDNGLPGVTMHNHANPPIPLPLANLNNNEIIGNRISGNAADTEDAMTSGPTGINIYSLVPVTGTMISQNVFEDESIDFAYNVPSGRADTHLNNFNAGAIGVDVLGDGPIRATENWWGCAGGPGASGCATAVGTFPTTLTFTPWLDAPFEP